MTINLEKGSRVNLSKESSASLKRIRAGLGWDANKFNTGSAYDLDVSCFVCNDNGGNPKLIDNSYFVFYNNKVTPDGAVTHTGDELTGDTAGDDESIIIDLTKLNKAANEISFVVTIHDAVNRKQNFGQVSNSYIKLYNDETGEEIAKYSLEDDFSVETAVQFGSVYLKDGSWMFKAVGAGYKRGLVDFVKAYGGSV